MKRTLLSVTILLSGFVTQAYAITALYYFSEPGDFVGQGQTVWVTPADNFVFNVSSDSNTVVFDINNIDDPTVPDQDEQLWSLALAAPFGAVLTVGAYEDAARWPFQEESEPGLDFSGNGRGSNTLTGRFDILEASYGPTGDLLQFAANFEQHSEGADPALFGQIRFNSTVAVDPIPLPAAIWLFGSGLLGLIGISRRKKQRNSQSSINRYGQSKPFLILLYVLFWRAPC